jgi:hypothetical protein
MDNLIILLSNILPWPLFILFFTRMILYNYFHGKEKSTFIDYVFPILPIGIMLPIRKSESTDLHEEKIARIANLVLYLFYATVLILIPVLLYGRNQQLLFFTWNGT